MEKSRQHVFNTFTTGDRLVYGCRFEPAKITAVLIHSTEKTRISSNSKAKASELLEKPVSLLPVEVSRL